MEYYGFPRQEKIMLQNNIPNVVPHDWLHSPVTSAVGSLSPSMYCFVGVPSVIVFFVLLAAFFTLENGFVPLFFFAEPPGDSRDEDNDVFCFLLSRFSFSVLTSSVIGLSGQRFLLELRGIRGARLLDESTAEVRCLDADPIRLLKPCNSSVCSLLKAPF